MAKTRDKIAVLSGYLFFVPSLYLILTRGMEEEYVRYHAAQSFFVWLFLGAIYLLAAPLRSNALFFALVFSPAPILGTAVFFKTGGIEIPFLSSLVRSL